MAERWFLKIDGIDGESTDASHKGELDILAWSWGVTQTGTGPGHAGGGGAGKADFQDFHFVSRISKASPKLLLAAASGSHFKWAALTGVRTAGKSQSGEFLKYKLSDVLVTSLQHADSEEEIPTEQFSLNYAKVESTYSPSTPSGKLGSSVSAGWDLSKNAKI
jgi:type VI secretion system secreted protein Hcp